MAKIVKFDSDARASMLKGVDILANTVKQCAYLRLCCTTPKTLCLFSAILANTVKQCAYFQL